MTKRAKNLNKTAHKIESGGQAVGRGIVKAAGGIGSALKAGSNFYISHTKGADESAAAELTEEQKKKLEKQKKVTGSIAKGTDTVVSGIGKGFGYVGTGIAKGVHYGHSKYKQTDYAKKKEEEEKAKGKTADSSAALGVAKASAHAVGSVFSGMKQGAVNVATDVRDTSVERTRHREGEAKAKLTHERYNMAGDIGVSTGNVASVYLVCTATGAIQVGTRIGSKVGAAAAAYDANKKHILFGVPWKMGWVSYRPSLAVGWKAHWIVVRNFTIALYAKPEDPWNKPIQYWKYDGVHSVKFTTEKVSKRPHSFEIYDGSSFLYFSTECNDLPDWKKSIEETPDYCEQHLKQLVHSMQSILYFHVQRAQRLEKQMPQRK